MTVTIKDSDVTRVLRGIDNVSEKASAVISTIDKKALTDAKVTDLSMDDLKKRVSDKHTVTPEVAPTVDKVTPKKPTPTLR